MVLAGTKWQIPLVKKLKAMGHSVLTVSPQENSPAFQFSDFEEHIDIRDLNECLALTEKYEITGVLSDQSDIAVPAVAFIATHLNIPGLTYEQAERCTNKLLMRKHCADIGFGSIKYARCGDSESLYKFFDNLSGRMVIKPLNSNSSRGVSIVENQDQLLPAFEEALSYTHGEKAVLLEEYIVGDEFTVDGVILGGRHHSLCVSKKKHYDHNPSIAYELFFSHVDAHYDYDLLRGKNDALYDSLNLPDGTLTHAEYKHNVWEFILIEYAARGAGNLVSSHICPYMSDFDNYAYYIRSRTSCTEGILQKKIINKQGRCAVLRFINVQKEGRVTQINGVEGLMAYPGIIEHEINIKVGDELRNPSNDACRVGYYIAVSDSVQSLRRLMGKIDRELEIGVV